MFRQVSGYAMPCGLADGSRRFRATYFLHLQAEVETTGSSLKTLIFKFIALRTSMLDVYFECTKLQVNVSLFLVN